MSGRLRRCTFRAFASEAAAFLIALALALASGRALEAQRLPFTHYETDDGLAATQVWQVTEDHRGLLWVATTWGLNRFDGSSFTTLTVADGLPSPTVRVVVEDAAGVLWIGTNAGLARYDGIAIESLVERGGAFAATVWAGARDRHGALWFATDHGLVSISGDTFRTWTAADGLASDYAYGILPTSDGALWVGSRGDGVSRCALERGGRLGACRVFTVRDGLGSDSSHALVEGKGGTIFLGMRDGGLTRFDGARFTTLHAADGLASNDVYALAIYGDELLVGTDNGMSLCALPAAQPCRTWSEKNGLPDDGVRYFFEDHEGVLWLGAEGGLARLARRDVLSYDERQGLPDAHVYALAADGAHGVWVGTFNGLAHLEIDAIGTPTTRVLHTADGLAANWIWSLLVDRRGALWIGTERGVSRLTQRDGHDRIEHWTRADGLAGDYVVALLEDRSGAIWAAATEGISRLDFAPDSDVPRITGFTAADGLPVPHVYAVAQDRLGRIWAAQGEHLSWFDGARFHAVGADAGLGTPTMRSLGVDRGGRLWVGGQQQVARLVDDPADKPPRFQALDLGGALQGYLVLTIAENTSGQLVLGTNRGVLTVDTRGPVAEIVGRFDRATGAPASEVSHSSAFTVDALGRFWFGFKGGASVLPGGTPAASAPPHAPALVFERLTTGGGLSLEAPFTGVQRREEPVLDGGAVTLPPAERTLRVETRALSLFSAEQVRYQFRLAGLEKGWSEARREGTREYVELAPGTYRLDARARFADGAWGEPVSLAIELEPAWYETRFAKALAVLLGAAAVFGAAQLRTRSIAQRNRSLASEVAARTDDLARYTRALEEHAHALDRANERIRLADRHRGEFLAKMSHELRTPLTSVLGFAALLTDALEAQIEARYLRYLQNIRESGNHLLRLINNLLDQAKIEAGRMELHLERASVQAVVESALAMVEGFAATRSVELRVDYAEGLPPVTVDVAKLRQIVINLLSNAIKFAPKESAVEVSVVPLAAAASRLGAPAYEIVVADRGPGIDPADHERIFEPFRQVAGRGETLPGTGLGLPIARQFANLLAGEVSVTEREGGGSEFHLVLPVERRERGALAAGGESASPPPAVIGGRASASASGVHKLESALAADTAAHRPRILVIEPDRGRFTALAAHLDRRGILAVRAPDAEEGVRMLRELRPAVVALDLDPGRPEAWSTLFALDRERNRSAVPWVLFAFARGSERGFAAGFDRCFVGPTDLSELASAVTRGAEDRVGQHRALSYDVVWIAAGEERVPLELDRALEITGLSICREPPRAAALAEVAAGGFVATLIDLGDGKFGGFDLAFAAQSAAITPGAWVAILPQSLPAGERRRLLELAESASEPAGAAVAAAVERLLSL